MANAFDTKTHWSSEEIHGIMGCRKFRNYKHILDGSHGSEWIDGGEFPMSLGLFATIPKAKRGAPLDRTSYRFLDAIHMDIAFGDCISVGGYCYALILVDRVTHNNWVFGLKTLLPTASLRLFVFSVQRLAPWLVVSTVTVVLSSLVGPSVTILLITLLKLLPHQPSINLLMF